MTVKNCRMPVPGDLLRVKRSFAPYIANNKRSVSLDDGDIVICVDSLDESHSLSFNMLSPTLGPFKITCSYPCNVRWEEGWGTYLEIIE